MGPGTEVSPQAILAEGGGCCNGNVGSSMKDANDETLDSPNQLNIGKPPRSLSVIRHCISSARLTGTAEWVSNSSPISIFNSSSNILLLIFRACPNNYAIGRQPKPLNLIIQFKSSRRKKKQKKKKGGFWAAFVEGLRACILSYAILDICSFLGNSFPQWILRL